MSSKSAIFLESKPQIKESALVCEIPDARVKTCAQHFFSETEVEQFFLMAAICNAAIGRTKIDKNCCKERWHQLQFIYFKHSTYTHPWTQEDWSRSIFSRTNSSYKRPCPPPRAKEKVKQHPIRDKFLSKKPQKKIDDWNRSASIMTSQRVAWISVEWQNP